MRHSFAVPVALLLLASACASDDAAEADATSRFTGRWFIEETVAHALYAASTYDLRVDGTVELVWDAGFYAQPQGQVLSPDTSVSCVFGEVWQAPDLWHLIIAGECSDQIARDIHLDFESAPAANAAGATVLIDDVGGEEGWQEPQFGWSFRKCPAADDPCHPEL